MHLSTMLLPTHRPTAIAAALAAAALALAAAALARKTRR
jgi:hypothetical protein